MSRNDSGEKILGNRKPGELIETFGDFWLGGMAGAVGRGLANFTETRRDRKAGNKATDFFADATVALGVTIEEAVKVTGQTRQQLDETK